MAIPPSSSAPSGGVMVTLFRHKWKTVLIPAFCLLIAVTVILFLPRTYHSEAVLVLQVGHESVGVDPTATTGQTIALQQTGRDDEVKSTVDIMQSRGVITKTVDRLGPEVVLGNTGEGEAESNAVADLLNSALGTVAGAIRSIDPISDREDAIITLEKSLVIDTQRGSTAIKVDIEADTPELAQTILASLIEVYQEEHARAHRNQNSQAFFQGQHDKLRKQLEVAKLAVCDAKDEMGIASIAGRKNSLENQRQSIELAKYQVEQELAGATAQIEHLDKELASMPERIATSQTTVPNEGADLMRQELYTLEIRKADLTARYNDTHPLVVAITAQVEKAKEVVDAQKSERQENVDDVNTVHQQLSLSLKQQQSLAAGLGSRLTTLGSQMQLVLNDLKLLNEYEVRLDRLDREVHLRNTMFYKYAKNLEEARFDQELEEQAVNNVYISQEPLLIEKPVSPSKMMILLASMFLATAGTGTAIMASERRQEKARERVHGEAKSVVHDEPEVEKSPELPVYTGAKGTSLREPALVPK